MLKNAVGFYPHKLLFNNSYYNLNNCKMNNDHVNPVKNYVVYVPIETNNTSQFYRKL